MIFLAIILTAGFLCVHIIKLLRLYLIVLDKKVPFERLIPAYLRTTLVNLIVPFKLGEIYRVGVFYRISGGFKTGFFSVLVDRFFDTFAIVMIILPYQLLVSGEVTIPAILLTVFLIVIVFAYVIFPSTYGFLNKYIIMYKKSSRSMAVLKCLETVNGWYEYTLELVKGRYGILLLLSFMAWALEIAVISGFARLFGMKFTPADFGNYIDSILSGKYSALTRQYNAYAILIILILTIVFLIRYLIAVVKR